MPAIKTPGFVWQLLFQVHCLQLPGLNISVAAHFHEHMGLTWLLGLAGVAASEVTGLAGLSFLLALRFFAGGSSRRFAKEAGSLRLPAVAAVLATGEGVGASAAWYATVACSDSVAWPEPCWPAGGEAGPASDGFCWWGATISACLFSLFSVKFPARHSSSPRECLQSSSFSFAGQVHLIAGSAPPSVICSWYLSSGWLPSHVAEMIFPSCEVLM